MANTNTNIDKLLIDLRSFERAQDRYLLQRGDNSSN